VRRARAVRLAGGAVRRYTWGQVPGRYHPAPGKHKRF